MIFIGVLTALWPLTGFPVTITLTEAESVYVPNLGGAITDLCVRSREILLFAAGAALVLFWLGERIFPDKPRRSPLLSRHALPLMAGTGLILLTAVLSGIFSLHPEISFWGIASESTGIAAFIGLAALFLAAYEGMSSPENLKYNTAIAAMMTYVNEIYARGDVPRGELRALLLCLNPVAPHITEEMWEVCGFGEPIYKQSWPTYDETKLVADEQEISVKITLKER